MARPPRSNAAQGDAVTESMEAGAEVIRAFVKTLPSAPGVYRMIDATGEVMYVGKARSLKARVTNYTRPEGLEVRLQRMIAATALVNNATLVTANEPDFADIPGLALEIWSAPTR